MTDKIPTCVGLAFLWIAVSLPPLEADESNETTPDHWVPLELASESLKVLVGEVTTNGPQILNREFTPYRSQGVLEGCGYSYQVLLKDWAYRSNQPTVVFGSLIFFAHRDGVPSVTLRIGLTDIEERDGALLQKNSPPHYAYLRYNSESTAGEEYGIVEGEGGARNFVYLDPESEKVAWFLVGDSITIAFNRAEGGTDLEFSIPIRNSKIWEDLIVCFRDLSKVERETP